MLIASQPATQTTTSTRKISIDPPCGAAVSAFGHAATLPSSCGAIQLGQRDAVVGEGLRLGILRLRERELGVGQLEDRPDADVEPALGEPEVFLGRRDQHARRLDPLLGGLDGDLRLLEALDERQLRDLDAGVGGAVIGLRFVVGAR